MRPFILLLTAIVFLGIYGCGDGASERPIPRRTAYPRIEAYDSTYISIPQSDLINIEVNASAEVTVPRDSAGILWIDVSYPRYGAVLHLTLNKASQEQLAQIARNRRQRFDLDTEGMRIVMTEVANPEAEVLVGKVLGLSVTPLNLTATDNASYFLSGALEFKRMPSAAEEALPIIDAVYGDIIHLGRTLRRL